MENRKNSVRIILLFQGQKWAVTLLVDSLVCIVMEEPGVPGRSKKKKVIPNFLDIFEQITDRIPQLFSAISLL